MINNKFLETIEHEIKTKSHMLVHGGGINNFEDYKYYRGFVNGLTLAKDKLIQSMKVSNDE